MRPRNRKISKHHLVAVIATDIGEIRIFLGFSRKESVQQLFDVLIECDEVVGISMFVDGKFKGGRDGKAS